MNPAQLLAHFDRMADTPDAIPRLRRFILDLAVRGKLVEQNQQDEQAAQFGVPEFVDGKDRLDMGLPSKWTWARVADVAAGPGSLAGRWGSTRGCPSASPRTHQASRP